MRRNLFLERYFFGLTRLLLITIFAMEARSHAQENQAGNTEPAVNSPAEEVIDFSSYGIYGQTAPRPKTIEGRMTTLPLNLNKDTRICFIGNTFFDLARHHGYFESMLHQRKPNVRLTIRNLSWSGDTIDLRPRPSNFADLFQHLHHERADLVIASFGFNESFEGISGIDAFKSKLRQFINDLKSKSFNDRGAPEIVFVSPIANENIAQVKAGTNNNDNLLLYTNAMREVAAAKQIGFIDLYSPTKALLNQTTTQHTFNGVHLNEVGYRAISEMMYRGLLAETPREINERTRELVIDKNRQYFRRYRPLNTFYYTGGRRKDYGYLDFLPAMRNFDLMVKNREDAIAASVNERDSTIDDSNVPELPKTKASRGANQWLSSADEKDAFKVDPRFEVSLFASEEEFPEIACPIQMRWDSQGRLWVSCSTTYPHVYPGKEPNDKLVILEDTDGDGKADQSTIFADDLHIPLSFEFGNGGVYVSEMPDLVFLKDTDGDGQADQKDRLLTGFGTEDSHHSLHDFIWTPDGDLLFRESIFHHSQVETPYGLVRQQNSGWFRFNPRTLSLTSFGTYRSTNPWGVTFDDWGQHVASHPVYAAAFHSLDPPYPSQHPPPNGLQAYSGTCGQEFVDFSTFPASMQSDFIKVRYKPTNRVEIHHWTEDAFGYSEKYVGDLIFSKNLSFIPVDIRFGPQGALYICDWYNPIKGHAQYSLRDERRDRHSGRIWRVTQKDGKLQNPPQIHGASLSDLLELLKRKESRIRYWVRRELRERDRQTVLDTLNQWVKDLDPNDLRFRHHQLEAIWLYRSLDDPATNLLRSLLASDSPQARAAATQQLRFWHPYLEDSAVLLRASANDPNAIVRMEAAIAASYIGNDEAYLALRETLNYPHEGHLKYAMQCAFGSESIRQYWTKKPDKRIQSLLKGGKSDTGFQEPIPTEDQNIFDRQTNLKKVAITCLPERMRFSVEQFAVTTGQPVKVVFTNPDATDHNLLILRPDSLNEVGMAANAMARDPKNANSDFIPPDKASLIVTGSPMIGPTRSTKIHVMRFNAPTEPGLYPFVCTFPGHWVIMRGQMLVVENMGDIENMLTANAPVKVRDWTLDDFPVVQTDHDEKNIMLGMQAFAKAGCNQCHQLAGHGINLGPDLTSISKRYSGRKLLQQLLEPSSTIHPDYQTWRVLMSDGKTITGSIVKEGDDGIQVMQNLLVPDALITIPQSEIDLKIVSKTSAMPAGLLNVLNRDEINSLVSFLETDGYKLPEHLKKHHGKHEH